MSGYADDGVQVQLTRRSLFGGLIAVLLVAKAPKLFLSEESDPIVYESPILAPPTLLLGDSLRLRGFDNPNEQYFLRARCMFAAVAYVRHRSGRVSIRDERGALWPVDRIS